MPAFLNVVPHELVLHPGDSLFGKFRDGNAGVVVNGEPLPALAADNGFSGICYKARLCGLSQAFGNNGFHQRGSRR